MCLWDVALSFFNIQIVHLCVTAWSFVLITLQSFPVFTPSQSTIMTEVDYGAKLVQSCWYVHFFTVIEQAVNIQNYQLPILLVVNKERISLLILTSA